MGNLAESFFVINNIEKDSGIINLSFTANEPQLYVDCGTATLTVNDTSHTINFAQNAQYPYVYEQGIHSFVGHTNRYVLLSGRINVYVKVVDDHNTRASANSMYVLSGNIERFTNTGQLYQRRPISDSFSSKSPSMNTDGGVACQSTGELESAVIYMAE